MVKDSMLRRKGGKEPIRSVCKMHFILLVPHYPSEFLIYLLKQCKPEYIFD